ncbi:hypothetical protein ACWGDE_24795 [Streptomyces sp. NPDC054956]
MSIRRETAEDDYLRTHGLMASLGGSLNPPYVETDPERQRFEEVIAHALYVNESANPPAGHGYPKRG